MSDESTTLELQGVGVTYATGAAAVHALRDVELVFEPGEYAALLGPSGSGKSTLLHVLGCLQTPTAGRYLLGGVDVGSLDRAQLADLRGQRIGFVFQRFHLLPGRTALDNVAVPLRLQGVGRREREARARQLLERVGLGDRATHRPGELSGGQQQRVAIARALANRPGVLLADEPTGSLDSAAGASVMELLEELRGEGRTVLIVTHDEALASRAARVIRLQDGRLVSSARVSDGRPA